jgi:hypothetical protein
MRSLISSAPAAVEAAVTAVFCNTRREAAAELSDRLLRIPRHGMKRTASAMPLSITVSLTST